MIRTRSTALLLVLMVLVGPAYPQCLDYEPSIVYLAGLVRRITYPGRPNYESIEAGDEPETGWYLILNRPICTNKKGTDDNYPARTHESRIQLVLRSAQYRAYKHFVDNVVVVEGSLFAASTGHHHANLLLTVTSIGRAPSQGDPTRCSGLILSGSHAGAVACCAISYPHYECTRLQFP